VWFNQFLRLPAYVVYNLGSIIHMLYKQTRVICADTMGSLKREGLRAYGSYADPTYNNRLGVTCDGETETR